MKASDIHVANVIMLLLSLVTLKHIRNLNMKESDIHVTNVIILLLNYIT